MQADEIVYDEVQTFDIPNLEELRSKRMVRTHDAKGVEYGFGNRAVRRNVALRGRSKEKRQFHMTDKSTLYSMITAPKNEHLQSPV